MYSPVLCKCQSLSCADIQMFHGRSTSNIILRQSRLYLSSKGSPFSLFLRVVFSFLQLPVGCQFPISRW
uniref:Putative ovule protein n=1 Tax=Solanum chacoense TaxID=4108 RepID=A0A0V0H156_SOLCH